MPQEQLQAVLRHLHRLLGVVAAADATDWQLLRRFAASREEAAFAALVRKHGPMVLGVCRRVLGHVEDAEDAFQATFLVLARKAATLPERGALSGWLFTVARHAALKARACAARRRAVERQARAAVRNAGAGEAPSPELRSILDAELGRLPDKYRLPLVLCYLQGRTNEEAAQELGWPSGTVKGRLARARELLRSRLAGRGLSLTPAAVSAAMAADASAAVLPAALEDDTLRMAAAVTAAATTVASASVLELADGTAHALTASRVTAGVALLAGLALLAAGTALLARPTHPPAFVPLTAAVAATPPRAADDGVRPVQRDDPDLDEWEEPSSLQKAVARLQPMTLEQWATAWKHDRNVTGRPAAAILGTLIQDLSLELEATPAQEQALKRPVTVRLHGRSRLELIEEVCRQAGLSPVYPGGLIKESPWDKTLRLKELPPGRPVAFAGPFRVAVERIEVASPPTNAELHLRVSAVRLPAAVAIPVRDGRTVTVARVVDAKGEDLFDRAKPWSAGGDASFAGYDITEDVPLRVGQSNVGVIQSLDGKVLVPVATRVDVARMSPVVPGASVTAGAVRVTLKGIGRGTRHINGEARETHVLDLAFRGTSLHNVLIAAHDARGRLLGLAGQTSATATGSGPTAEGFRKLSFYRLPASVTVKIIAERQKVEYPFHLEDVRLPTPLSPAVNP